MKILQISDIHWHNIHALTDVYRDIREGLIQDIRNYCYEKATIFDHILICGDIAYSGNEVEYRKADEFLNELCNAAGCKPSEVFMVPVLWLHHKARYCCCPQRKAEFCCSYHYPPYPPHIQAQQNCPCRKRLCTFYFC